MYSSNIRTLQDTLEYEFRRWLDRLPCYMSTEDYDKWLEAVREDMRAIMEHWPREQTLVSPSDHEMILDLIENPPEPSEKLKQAAQKANKPKYSFTCSSCGSQLMVKDWRIRPTTNTREPWCWCPSCKYTCYAERNFHDC